jgi:hypothetical protein
MSGTTAGYVDADGAYFAIILAFFFAIIWGGNRVTALAFDTPVLYLTIKAASIMSEYSVMRKHKTLNN